MIGVIGCGNMASAIVTGVHSQFMNLNFFTYTPSFIRAEELASKVSGQAVRTLKELDGCNTLIIACKPQQFNELAVNLRREVNLKNKLIISIMAAISTARISQLLGVQNICRVMPNTPALVGEGVSLIYYSDRVSHDDKMRVESYFTACSKVHILKNEELFDKVTVVSGSGPAYVFYFAKTMIDALKRWDVSEAEARKIVTQLFKGSVKLMEEQENKTIGELVDQVTSKKGVTIEAVTSYQSDGLEAITLKALEKAWQRSLEIQSEL